MALGPPHIASLGEPVRQNILTNLEETLIIGESVVRAEVIT